MHDKSSASGERGAFPKNHPPILSHDEWAKAHRAMLVKEKAQMSARDALVAERRRMPWMAVDADYKFEGPRGRVGLLDLFAGRRQLVHGGFISRSRPAVAFSSQSLRNAGFPSASTLTCLTSSA
jgi:predicted dithiol-disulfide oxidoreductase (DUF899 family)